MKKLLLIPILGSLACHPSKSETKVDIKVKCNACFVNIQNAVYFGNPNDYDTYAESVYIGDVHDSISLSAYRYSSGINCLRTLDYNSFNTDSVEIWFIENNDTILYEKKHHRATAWCN